MAHNSGVILRHACSAMQLSITPIILPRPSNFNVDGKACMGIKPIDEVSNKPH